MSDQLEFDFYDIKNHPLYDLVDTSFYRTEQEVKYFLETLEQLIEETRLDRP